MKERQDRSFMAKNDLLDVCRDNAQRKSSKTKGTTNMNIIAATTAGSMLNWPVMISWQKPRRFELFQVALYR